MKFIIANWKMNMNGSSIEQWFEEFNKTDVENQKDKLVLIAPSAPYLDKVSRLIKHQNVKTCAQDIDIYTKGAHTGSIGAFQIKDFADYTIVGHSERRERQTLVSQKVEAAAAEGLTPIVCFVNADYLNTKGKQKSIYTWEDPQNISHEGMYRPKDPNEVATEAKKLRKVLAKGTTLLYGGSVNRDNVEGLSKIAEIDGYLVGNASLDPSHFYDIIIRA